ncbi:MAG: benzoate-CoA ligase family protein [Flavobacteriaceae bacterium]
MSEHQVRIDRSTQPARFDFDSVLNVTMPFVDRHMANGKSDDTILRWRGGGITFGQLHEGTCRMANLLRDAGIGAGDRVMLLVRDCPEFHYAFLGAARIGAVAVPVNYFLRAHDYEYMLQDSAARAIVVSGEAMNEVLPALERAGDVAQIRLATDDAPRGFQALSPLLEAAGSTADPAPTTPETDCFWLYSSGSTGSPKASVHQHKDMIYTAHHYGVGIAGLDGSQTSLSPAKLFFAYGLGNSLSFPLWIGSQAVMMEERPTPEGTLDMITETRPDVFFGIPTLYASMLNLLENGYQADLTSLRLCPSGGEPLPPALYERWKKLTGIEITDSIGSSEVLHFYTANRPGSVRLGSGGAIVPGYEGRIVDPDGNDLPDGEVGELAIKGESTARYYWNKPERTAEAMRDGWFHTGDMCFRDADGYYHFCGRGNDMLKVGGIWVSPFEVESALVGHEAVLEAAVAGRPDENGLIKPAAFVVLKDRKRATPELEAELRDFVRTRLAPFKYPRWIEFLDDLPKTSSGKIQRFRLKSEHNKAAK